MTKNIKNIVQNDSGGTNPDTHAHEDKIWELTFEDNDITNLTRMKMIELLTKGTVPTKTVHSFRKWELTTTQGAHIRTWVIVYDDKSHIQLTNNDFYSLLSNGHKNKEDEVKDEVKEEIKIEGKRGAVSSAIAQAQRDAGVQLPKKSLTTPEEQEQLKELREDIKDNYFPVFGKKEDKNLEEEIN
tara:strand:+ start:61 stop:615 length:555 start_codon:yes stop_codon:yes gene_type:complete